MKSINEAIMESAKGVQLNEDAKIERLFEQALRDVMGLVTALEDMKLGGLKDVIGDLDKVIGSLEDAKREADLIIHSQNS